MENRISHCIRRYVQEGTHRKKELAVPIKRENSVSNALKCTSGIGDGNLEMGHLNQ